MLLFYIRHGDPIYNPDSLTPLGHEQAKALAKRLLLYGVDQVYSSPSTRARQTAQPFCDLARKPMTICDWADEGLAGQNFFVHNESGHNWCFQNAALIPLFASPAIRALGDRWYEHPDLAGYSFAQGVERVNTAVDGFFESLGLRHDRENGRYEMIGNPPDRVALFAHQGFGLSFFSSVLDIPYPQFSVHFDFGHSSMSVIEFQQQGDYYYPRALQVSNESHLYREGLMTGYHNVVRF